MLIQEPQSVAPPLTPCLMINCCISCFSNLEVDVLMGHDSCKTKNLVARQGTYTQSLDVIKFRIRRES